MAKKPYTPAAGSGDNVRKQNTTIRPQFRQLSEDAPTWDSVRPEVLAAVVCMLTTQGASPTFGYTRNGRSLTLAVWWKGDRDVQYLTSGVEVEEYAVFLAREWFRLDADEIAEYGLSPSVID